MISSFFYFCITYEEWVFACCRKFPRRFVGSSGSRSAVVVRMSRRNGNYRFPRNRSPSRRRIREVFYSWSFLINMNNKLRLRFEIYYHNCISIWIRLKKFITWIRRKHAPVAMWPILEFPGRRRSIGVGWPTKHASFFFFFFFLSFWIVFERES